MSEYPGKALDGLPEVIEFKAKHYQKIANSITRAVNTLRSISDSDSMEGDGIDAIRDKSGDLADDISKAQLRYANTAEALTTYASSLRTAQSDAETANSHLKSILGADFDFSNTFLMNQEQTTGDHADEVKTWVGKWNSAQGARDHAAGTARKAIEDVVTGKHNNGLEDPKKHWWQKALDIVKKVCQVAGVLSIFLAWVPVLGEILLVLTAIGGAIDIIEGVVDMAQNGFSWGAMFKIGIGALSVVGGLGALASKGGRIANLVGRYGREGKNAVRALSSDASLAAKGRAFSKAAGGRWWNGVKGAYRGLKNSGFSGVKGKLAEKLVEKGKDITWAVTAHGAGAIAGEGGRQAVLALKNGTKIIEDIKKAPIAIHTLEDAGKAANAFKSEAEGAKDAYDTHQEQSKADARDERMDREEKQAIKDAAPGDKAEVKREYEQMKKDVDGGFGKDAKDDVVKGLKSTVSGGAWGGD